VVHTIAGRRPRRSWSGRPLLLAALFGLLLALGAGACGDRTITLHGAVQFADDHTFNKTLLEFERLVKEYYGQPINFVLHRNSELGLEKDYFAYMNQGLSVDYAIVSPAHMSTFAPSAPLMDMPFLFRDLDHWRRVLDEDLLAPIAEEVAEKADVQIIGYAGGGVRNLIVNRPVRTMDDLRSLKIRVMGAPIQTDTFQAMGASPTVIAYAEIYSAIQTGVIAAAENEAQGLEQMKFYEVGRHISETQHAITVRPICFSLKTLRRLPEDLQAAILRAGREAGRLGRELEAADDRARLDRLAAEGKIELVPFADRAALLSATEPVRVAYAESVGAAEVYARIRAAAEIPE
jgi:TRAP-type C4-dicarboxylate transport system substrate-binding protein